MDLRRSGSFYFSLRDARRTNPLWISCFPEENAAGEHASKADAPTQADQPRVPIATGHVQTDALFSHSQRTIKRPAISWCRKSIGG
jgi:hypothetical protein